MRSMTTALESHYQQTLTTIATCWKVTRQDGAVFGFTDHDADIEVSGVLYQARTGFTATAVRSSSALDVDNLEIEGMLDAVSITEADIVAGRWDFATVEVFEVNYAAPTAGTLKIRKGVLGELRTERTRAVAEIRGLMQKLAHSIGRSYLPTCDADLGDARCKVNLATFSGGTIATSVTEVTSQRQFTASSLGQAADWFKGGKVTFTEGPNVNMPREVKSFAAGGLITLHLPMAFPVSVGEDFTIVVGCDKLVATCNTKFANVVNFRGFPHIPGIDRMVSGK